MTKKKIGIIGHRVLENAKEDYKRTFLHFWEHKKDIEAVYIGMGRGFDMMVAGICKELEIPFVAVVPFEGWTDAWSRKDQEAMEGIFPFAKEVMVVDEWYTRAALKRRNRTVIHLADEMVVYWNGLVLTETGGAIWYASQLGRPIRNMNKVIRTHKKRRVLPNVQT